MKIAILAAGKSDYFPLFFDKPKCLYSVNGKIQLQRVIETVKKVFKEEEIIVVGGYKYKYIMDFLKKYPDITLKINYNYKKSAIYSFRKAKENETEDMVFLLADERISAKNIRRISESNRKLAILYHDRYYYYSVGIIKLRNDVMSLIDDDKYLSMNEMKKIYMFANNKSTFDGGFNINSGICLGYIFIDLVRRVGGIKKIENPEFGYKGEAISFIKYDPSKEYYPDLDYFEDTDEYKENFWLRMYSKYISTPIRRGIRLPLKIQRKLIRIIESEKRVK